MIPKEISLKVNGLLKMHKPTTEDYEEVLNALEEIKEQEENYYDEIMRQILLKRGRLKEAKYYLEKHYDENSADASTYYDFYRIEVAEEKYMDAYLDLYKYKEKNKEAEISLPLTILEMIVDIEYNPNLYFNTEYAVQKTDKLFQVEFADQETKEKYHQIIDDVNNRDYDTGVKDLKELEFICKDKNIDIDIRPLKKSLGMLKRKQEEAIENQDLDLSFIPMPINEKKLEARKKHISELSQEDRLRFIYIISDYDPVGANALLESLDTNTKVLYDSEVNYLKNLLNERMIIKTLNKKQKQIFKHAMEEGHEAMRKSEYQNAYDYYCYGKYITNHPIFDYYIGKTLYMAYQEKGAYTSLLNYIEKGGERVLPALAMLRILDSENGAVEQGRDKKILQKKITSTFHINYDIGLGVPKSKNMKPIK